MNFIFGFLGAILFIALIVGLISPKKVLFFIQQPEKRTRMKVLLYYVGTVFILMLLNFMISPHENENISLKNEKDNDSIVAEKLKIEKQKQRMDSVTITKLLPLFNVKKDEFSTDQREWIIPKSAPKYRNSNGIYCYFQRNGNSVSNFRFVIQYSADDWLFIQKYIFSIDGKVFEFIPINDVERDNSGGKIWEWCDEKITASHGLVVITNLIDAKEAKIKYEGRQYHNVKKISAKQLQGIKDAIELYKAMGGKFDL